ncbi:excinuclease ABC subunit UvrC [Halanaerobacter jeridensis]|uniref:UvrABC system protein C n=1 Tax=Halanaerobacter jeridensis TaxID=706427 RepID=A0A939BPQ2_9FIRM|nr:excinuclease ABC subunit UvrC [Halanaerobacter jeridensis]MBM7557347.1 excinuclease ABC subunit C [Halanaerobacter jeridensis]
MDLNQKANNLPQEPGVYLMKDETGTIIYVGKAKSLKNRVSSYFQNAKHQRFKTKVLVEHISDFEYIVTDTEVEALILENNLIKKHNPKYNIQLKDDKTYPYIKVSVNQNFPRVYKTRVIKNDGARYFGPYTDVRAVNNLLELIHDLYPLRTCKKAISDREERACLNYHIDKCAGPCINEISQDEYNEMIDEIVMLLEGKEKSLIQELKTKMEIASENLDYEAAAKYRDQIEAINKLTQKQKIVSENLVNQDVIATTANEEQICLQLLIVRNGRLIGKENFIFKEEESIELTITAFLQQYYDAAYYVPQEILLESELEDQAVIEEWLAEQQEKKIEIKVPKQGNKRDLVDMAAKNAYYNLKEHNFQSKMDFLHKGPGVESLGQYLGLDKLPYRIEGFDISHIQGTDTVASLVVFEGGKPKKSDYRRFKIESVSQPDDFASMKEVITRRYSKLIEEEREFPDLILIDGGKGQLSSALSILEDLGRFDQNIISLVKREEEVFVPGESEPIVLPKNSEALHLVQRVRDEAHRFAVNYHRKLRSRRLTHSMLDDISGVGPQKRKDLLNHFGSLQKIKQAGADDLTEVKGVGPKLAEKIKEYLEMNLRP